MANLSYYNFFKRLYIDVFAYIFFFFFQAEDGIRDLTVTGVQTCALPICRLPQSRQQHVGEIEAGDQEDDDRHAEQHGRDSRDVALARGRRADGETRDRRGREGLVLLFDGERFLEIRRQSFERRFRGGGRKAGFEPANDDQLLPSAIAEGGLARLFEIVRDPVVVAEWQPDLDGKDLERPGKTARRDSHDRERMAVDKELGAEHGRIEIMFLPVGVADDRDRRVAAERFLFRREGASAGEGNAENGKIIRADDSTKGAPRVALLAESDHSEVVGHDIGEDGVLGADVLVSRVGKAAIRFRVPFVLRENLDDFLRLRIRRRREEHRVDEAEHGGIRADAERENDGSRGRKSWRLEKLAESESKIVDHMQWDAARWRSGPKNSGREGVASVSAAGGWAKWSYGISKTPRDGFE